MVLTKHNLLCMAPNRCRTLATSFTSCSAIAKKVSTRLTACSAELRQPSHSSCRRAQWQQLTHRHLRREDVHEAKESPRYQKSGKHDRRTAQ
jgi:hypothetical protein